MLKLQADDFEYRAEGNGSMVLAQKKVSAAGVTLLTVATVELSVRLSFIYDTLPNYRPDAKKLSPKQR